LQDPEDEEKSALLEQHGLGLHHALSLRPLPRKLLACLRILTAGSDEVQLMRSGAKSPLVRPLQLRRLGLVPPCCAAGAGALGARLPAPRCPTHSCRPTHSRRQLLPS
jgi:hypothetical protein